MNDLFKSPTLKQPTYSWPHAICEFHRSTIM